MTKPQKQRLIVGISGATGTIYGIKVLQMLRKLDVETHLVISRAGEITRSHETPYSHAEVAKMADVVYPVQDISAAIASGSYKTLGMIIAPCSIRSMSEIAMGTTTSLLTRAADVVLKERRRLVLMLRETPLHAGHLRNMLAVTEMGGIIMPPVPAFYTRPKSIDDIVAHSAGRALALFGLEVPDLPRWGETIKRGNFHHEP